MNTHIKDNFLALGGTFVYKSSDESVNNSDTLQDDDELLFAVGANELWIFQFWLDVVDTTSADFSYGFSGPAGSAIVWAPIPQMATSGSVVTTIRRTTAIDTEGAGQPLHHALGRIDTAGTSGTLQLEWSQVNVTANNTTIRAGSWLTAREVT